MLFLKICAWNCCRQNCYCFGNVGLFYFCLFFLLLFVEGYEALAERERRLQVCNVRSLETGRGFRARGFDHVSEKQFTFWVDEISE